MRLIAPVLRWARTKETFAVQPRRNVLLLRLDQGRRAEDHCVEHGHAKRFRLWKETGHSFRFVREL